MLSSDYSLASGELRVRGGDGRLAPVAAPASAGLKVSPTILQIVDRVRSRFGLAIEVVGAGLQPLLPETGGDLSRAVEGSGPARAALSAALQAGRNRRIDVDGGAFVVQPLRGGRTARQTVGLLAVREAETSAGEGPGAAAEGAERWIEFLRIAIEAELSSAEGLREERQQARRTLGALRFLGQLGGLMSEPELARAVVHAAAVWFDVDARLYRRDLSGTFVLHTCLPGVTPSVESRRLGPHVLKGDERIRRTSTAAEVEGLAWAVPEALLVAVEVEGTADWLLALGGVVPREAQVIVETVADSLGSHLARLGAASAAAARGRFEALACQGSRAPELIVMHLLRQVMDEAGAGAGAVTLVDADGSRRLAAVGALPASSPLPSVEAHIAADRVVLPMALCMGDRAALELAPADGESFSAAAVAMAREALPLLQVVLLGVLRRDDQHGDVAALAAGEAAVPRDASFLERIRQEVERAKRFDLGLSMLMLDVEAQSADPRALRDLIALVRAELRGSDVLGLVGQARIGALLVHTDVSGIGAVISRVRQKLALQSSHLPAVRMGRAVLSRDCATTEALLRQADQIIES